MVTAQLLAAICPTRSNLPSPSRAPAVAFTQHLSVLGVHNLFLKGSQGGKDSPRTFCDRSRAAGGDGTGRGTMRILRSHVVPLQAAAETMQWGWETPPGPSQGPTSGITW